jgi:glycine betaine/proline transport system permease protein
MTDKPLFSPGALVAPVIKWLNENAHGLFSAISTSVEASLRLAEAVL